MRRSRVNLSRAIRLAVVAAAIVAISKPAFGEEPPTPLPKAGDDKTTTLYLVVRTGPKEEKDDILETLKTGLKKSLSSTATPPTIRPVSPAFFEEFAALVDKAAGNEVADAKDGMSIKMLPSVNALYELKVLPTQVLKELRVTYLKAGLKTYTPAAPGAKVGTGGSLILIVPGRYAFTPEPGLSPASYEADVAELGQPDGVQKGAWPAGDKFFVVTMRDFKGNRDAMFAVIQDPKQVANPLDSVQLGNDLLFAFAGLNSTKVKPNGPISDGFLTVTVPTVPKRTPKRVWVYFPLDEKTLPEAKEKYKEFDRNQLPVEIRKTSVAATIQDAKVGPKDPPRWFELSGEGAPPGGEPTQFSRRIKLDGMSELTEKYPRVWMLQVWEFDDGKPQAIMVEHPKEDRVTALEAELQGWAKGLQDDISKKTPTTPPTPPKKP